MRLIDADKLIERLNADIDGSLPWTEEDRSFACGLISARETVTCMPVCSDARLLTAEEIRDGKPDYLYVEHRNIPNIRCVLYNPDKSDGRFAYMVYGYDESLMCMWSVYGRFWRCWSRRPMEEQRKAAEWND